MRKPPSSTLASEAGGTKTPCCVKVGLKRGPWTPEEDELLANFINREGEGKWRTLPKRAGLLRCGKSCRLRWMNYLRPSVKRGHIAPDEEDLILRLHRLLGNRWSLIAGRIPGRTDNEIKNYWNTHLSKKLISQGIDPRTHKPLSDNNHDSSKPSAVPPNPNLLLPSNYNSDESNTGVLVGADPPMVEPEFCVNSTRNSTFHPNVNANALISISANRNSFEDQEDDPNYCNDEVFSTFLNSLINEDIFTQPMQSVSAFGAPVWEAPPLISTTADATFHNSHVPPDDQPQ